MTTALAEGGPDAVLDEQAKRRAVRAALELAGDVSRVLALPPDASRIHSDAGTLTPMLYQEAGADTFDVMPALGTHYPMTPDDLRRMFGTVIPLDAFMEHRWRDGLVRLGVVPADFVHEVSDGVLRESMPDYDVPVEINRTIVEGGYTATFSIGQVVPHEVVGMANGVKNVLVGAGGRDTINRTHFLGAAFGMERMMGRADTPVRAVLNYAHDHYLKDLRVVYVMTVMEQRGADVVMRGLFVGDDTETFDRAAELSRQVNVNVLDEAPERVVADREPEEFRSTWLGNKAVYRTRMAIADGGELVVIAPGVRTFGEDPDIDRLVRRYGYHGTPTTLESVAQEEELRANLSAAAHLIHGSSEGRFRIVYATDPGLLSREEVEGVGFEWRDVADALRQYPVDELADGDNGEFYFVSRPALGLWAARGRFGG